MTIRLFEMFAGYGGASFALKKNGIEHKTIGFSEIKEHAIELYQLNHPNIKNYGDCIKINPHELEDFDLLTGGFPCQDCSLAGKNDLSKGRTILFNEIIRIAEIKKPRFMLLENVKGLLSKKHNSFYQHTLSELHRLNYHVIVEILNSKNYGIPHNRERVWYVCFREKEDLDLYETPQKEELSKSISDLLESNITTNVFKHTNRIDYSKIPTNLSKTNKIVKISLPNNFGKIHQQDQLIFDNGVLPCLVGTVMGITKSCKLIYPQLRFLTAKECFRFMGFSNDEINLGTLKINKLYDIAGNGWDINVAGRILTNMFKNYKE